MRLIADDAEAVRVLAEFFCVFAKALFIKRVGNFIGHFKCIQPFVGVGAGMAFVETEARVPGDTHSKDNTKFSGMGTLGLAMPFGQFEVDIAARYNYVDVASGLHNFSGDIGVRYMF